MACIILNGCVCESCLFVCVYFLGCVCLFFSAMDICPHIDCGESYDDHSQLIAHFKDVHHRVLCAMPGCHVHFLEQRYAREHYQNKHVGTAIQCMLCNRWFKQRGGYHNHKARCVAVNRSMAAAVSMMPVATQSFAPVPSEVAVESSTSFQSIPVVSLYPQSMAANQFQTQSLNGLQIQSQSTSGVQSMSNPHSAEPLNSLDDQFVVADSSHVISVLCEPDMHFLASELGWNDAQSVGDSTVADFSFDDNLFDDMSVDLAEPVALCPVPVQPVLPMFGNMVPRLSTLAYNMVKVLIDVAVIVVDAVEHGFAPVAGPSRVAHKREASLVPLDAKKRCLAAGDSSDCMFCILSDDDFSLFD